MHIFYYFFFDSKLVFYLFNLGLTLINTIFQSLTLTLQILDQRNSVFLLFHHLGYLLPQLLHFLLSSLQLLPHFFVRKLKLFILLLILLLNKRCRILFLVEVISHLFVDSLFLFDLLDQSIFLLRMLSD